jgi:serine/threonine protein kinase
MAAREEREGIIYDNPEKFYDFEEEIGSGKMATVKKAKSKVDGKVYAAKMIYFDDDTRFAMREFDLLKSGKLGHKGLVGLHEAYMVRKYLILMLDLVDGKTLLDQFYRRHSATEDDVAFVIGELCEVLDFLHQQNVLHLDIRPTNIRFEGRDIKLLDYNSARHLANKKAGAVVDVIGDTEFCAPEMLNFDPVLPASDMWSVAIITYILLSGVSPFFYEDEAEVLKSVQGVKFTFCEAFDEISSEAKDFIKKCLLRAPEMRMTAADALKHPWLSSENTAKRKQISLLQTALDTMEETDARLLSEEEEDYVEASFVFRTFEEEEYESPEEESDED